MLAELVRIESIDNDDLFALLAILSTSSSPRSTNIEDCEEVRALPTVGVVA